MISFFPTISEQTYGNVYILSKFFKILFKKLINNQILILKKILFIIYKMVAKN